MQKSKDAMQDKGPVELLTVSSSAGCLLQPSKDCDSAYPQREGSSTHVNLNSGKHQDRPDDYVEHKKKKYILRRTRIPAQN